MTEKTDLLIATARELCTIYPFKGCGIISELADALEEAQRELAERSKRLVRIEANASLEKSRRVRVERTLSTLRSLKSLK